MVSFIHFSLDCSVQPKDLGQRSGNRANAVDGRFQIFGFDVILDADAKPWLIEVNAAPSFACGSGVDHEVKSAVVESALRLVTPPPPSTTVDATSRRRRRRAAKPSPEEAQARREAAIYAAMRCDDGGDSNSGNGGGGFRRIFPVSGNQKKYSMFAGSVPSIYSFTAAHRLRVRDAYESRALVGDHKKAVPVKRKACRGRNQPHVSATHARKCKTSQISASPASQPRLAAAGRRIVREKQSQPSRLVKSTQSDHVASTPSLSSVEQLPRVTEPLLKALYLKSRSSSAQRDVTVPQVPPPSRLGSASVRPAGLSALISAFDDRVRSAPAMM